MIKVFIVDDHYIVIEGLRSLLSDVSDIEVAGYATTANACLQFCAVNNPDVILMDINMPEMSGIELCNTVRSLYPSVMVLALSTYNQDSYVKQMVEKGASGYLLKNTDQEELVDAIRSIYRGKTYFNREVSKIMASHARQENAIPLLTRREKEILSLVAQGYTTPEIAQKLFVSEATVNSHRRNLLDKIQAKNTAVLIRFAIENNLV